ncbi:hypothetical protein [Endozoicomonas arenosclerae]|uniref:hypothetical protein n=1 Tax=Endozoicomonas arenosclerae TaxID=1633495 RepID=UPI00078021C6|nr:hypothetical protein [Endozoicomonas arenosclerae]
MAFICGHQDFSQKPVYSIDMPKAASNGSEEISVTRGLNYVGRLSKSYPELALAEREVKGIDTPYLVEIVLNVIWQLGSLISEFIFSEEKHQAATGHLITLADGGYLVNAREYLSVMVLNPAEPDRKKRHARTNLARVMVDTDRQIQERLRKRSDWQDLIEVFSAKEVSGSLGPLSLHSLRNNLLMGRPAGLPVLNTPKLSLEDIRSMEDRE